jgi:hypothetical protein
MDCFVPRNDVLPVVIARACQKQSSRTNPDKASFMDCFVPRNDDAEQSIKSQIKT